jgi:hypothetical protein
MIVFYKDFLKFISFIWLSLHHTQGGQGQKMLEWKILKHIASVYVKHNIIQCKLWWQGNIEK